MKKIAVLFGLFAALGLFVYLTEFRGAEDREATRELEQSLLGLSQEEISSFDIERPGDPLIRIVHQSDEWRIQAPVEGSVDRFVVDAFLRDTTGARKLRTLEDVSQRLSDYGLSEPRLTVTLRKGAEDVRKLLIGKEDFSGDQVYTRIDGRPEVYLTGKSIVESCDKRLREWRSKTVLDYDPDAVTLIEVQQGKETIRLSKQASGWRLMQPIEDRASSTEVSALLSAVKYSRIEDFIDEPGPDQDYGFDSLNYRFRVRNGDAGQWRTLEVGQERKGQEVFYARDPTRPLVFTIRKSVVDKLASEAAQFRDRQVVDLRQDGFDELRYWAGEIEFKLARGGAGFVVVEPQRLAGQEAPAYKFWYPIQDLSFVTLSDQISAETDPRFATPILTLEFKVGVEVRLYEFVESDGEIWARQTQTGRAGTVAREEFDKIRFTADQIVNPGTQEQ